MSWFIWSVITLFALGGGIALYEWRKNTVLFRHDYSHDPNKIIGPDAVRAKLEANGGGAGFNGMKGP